MIKTFGKLKVGTAFTKSDRAYIKIHTVYGTGINAISLSSFRGVILKPDDIVRPIKE